MKGCAVLWNEEDQQKILAWWRSLQSHGDDGTPRRSAWRAELRRAESPTDALLSAGFRGLYLHLAGSFWSREDNLLGLGAVAGVLAHVDSHDETHSFAEMCAIPRDEGRGAAVSDLRFSQLQKSRTFDELYTRMRRTVQLLRRKTNVISAADGILHWYRENVVGDVFAKPRDRVLVRWGLEYFQQLPLDRQE